MAWSASPASRDQSETSQARAAVRRGRRRIGKDTAHADIDERDIVHAGQAARKIEDLNMRADRSDILMSVTVRRRVNHGVENFFAQLFIIAAALFGNACISVTVRKNIKRLCLARQA